MSTASDNPKVAAIRQSLQDSYTQLNQLLAGPLAALSEEQLYAAPLDNEWTLMQNLAHINEILPYWATEIEKLVAHPGQNFGRTQQHEGRLRAIEEHGKDSLAQIRRDLPNSYARMVQVIDHLRDSDLELVGHHGRFGDRTLEWFIGEFVTDHLANHIKQMKAVLAALDKEPGE